MAQYEQLINEGYTTLTNILDKKYDVEDILDLVAIATNITAAMSCTNQDRKVILMAMIKKYIDEEIEDKTAALIVYSTLNVSIDVLFNFKKGKYAKVSKSILSALKICCKK